MNSSDEKDVNSISGKGWLKQKRFFFQPRYISRSENEKGLSVYK